MPEARNMPNLYLPGVAPRYLADFECLEGKCPTPCGEEDMTRECPVYPRWLWHNGSQVEMCGMLSCPEMARLCLTRDQAMDLVEFDASSLEQGAPSRSEAEPFYAYEPTVKQVLLDTLSLDERPLAARLFALASFAEEIDPVLADASCGERDMAPAVEAMSSGRHFSVWKETGGDGDRDDTVPMAVLQFLFHGLMGADPQDRMAGRVKDALATYATSEDTREIFSTGDSGLRIDCTVLADAYARRQAALPESLREGVDHLLTRMLRNAVLSQPYTTAASLVRYVQDLIAIQAAARFLLLSDSALDQAVATDTGSRDMWSGEQLETAASDAAHLLARALRARPHVLDELDEVLHSEGLRGRAMRRMLAGL